MIYLFYGEKHFRDKLLNAWKDAFKSKYDDLNLFHVKNFLDHDFNFYSQNLLSSGLFSSKSFFIIDDFPINIGEKDSENIKYQEYFLNILDKISKENIIVFNNKDADKRSKLFKKIHEIGEIKDFSIKNREDLIKKLQEVYNEKISIQAINKLILLKGEDFLSISGEIEKLLLTKDFIDISDLGEVNKTIEENIFEIIDDILNLNTKNAILKLRELAFSLDNLFLLYNILVSNLRIYFYIFSLKTYNISNNEIIEKLNLGNRGFLVGKNYKIKHKDFIKLYQKISLIDEKLKSGKLIGNTDKEFMYEIEKSLIVY